jgi:hypothetical protein
VANRVCDLENLVSEEAVARVGLQRHVKQTYSIIMLGGPLAWAGRFGERLFLPGVELHILGRPTISQVSMPTAQYRLYWYSGLYNCTG